MSNVSATVNSTQITATVNGNSVSVAISGANQVTASISNTGPQGPAGAAGATGPAGPIGPVGPPGPAATPVGRTVTAASVTMSNNDVIVDINNNTSAVAIAGAPLRTAFKPYTIKDSGGHAFTYNITYTPNSGLIDGQPNAIIQQNYDSLTIYSDGTNEFIQ